MGKNYEMTGQVKINSGDQISFYGNGEQHSSTITNPQDSWHGCKNSMRIYANGSMGFVKELYHQSGGNTGHTNTIATKTGTTILGKWATVKYVSYNVNNDTHRKLDGYVSINNDNKFRKVIEYTDAVNWLVSDVSDFNAFMAAAQEKSPATLPRIAIRAAPCGQPRL